VFSKALSDGQIPQVASTGEEHNPQKKLLLHKIGLSLLEHEHSLTTSDFTLVCPRVQAVEEDEIVLEVLIS
jgi:hypothetical protein